jgi:Ca-activated chloride channel family protein
MKGLRYIYIIVAFFVCGLAQAQTDRTYIAAGNKLYRQGQFAQSEVMYRKAIDKNPRNPHAVYNLGNALLMQKKDSLALIQYQNAAKMETSKMRLAKSYHNMGVIFQSRQMYQEAIQAYEQALRNNSRDNETRYNLVLCKKQLKNNPPKNDRKNNKNKKNKNDKDKNKDKNKQDQNKDKNKDKDQQKKNQQNKNQMSKDNAEQLLNAAIQQEQATQQRMKKAMQQPRTRQLQKNW